MRHNNDIFIGLVITLLIVCLEGASGEVQRSNDNNVTAHSSSPATLDISTPALDSSNTFEATTFSPSAQAQNPTTITSPANPIPSAANPIAVSYAGGGSLPTSPLSPIQGGYDPTAPLTQGYNYPTPPAAQQNTTNVIVVGMGPGTQVSVTTNFNLTNYLRNPTEFISAYDYEDAYYGAAEQILEVTEAKDFLDFITRGYWHKLTRGYKTSIVKNIVRLIYFTFQLLYPIIVAAVQEMFITFFPSIVCTLTF